MAPKGLKQLNYEGYRLIPAGAVKMIKGSRLFLLVYELKKRGSAGFPFG